MNRSKNNTGWSKGVPQTWLIDPWRDITLFMHKSLICEGRYSIMFPYHIHLLYRLKEENKKIDMPFFLLKILTMMEAIVQKNSPNLDRYIFHHSLVKLIVVEELRKINFDWDKFLERSGFQEGVAVMENPQIIGNP